MYLHKFSDGFIPTFCFISAPLLRIQRLADPSLVICRLTVARLSFVPFIMTARNFIRMFTLQPSGIRRLPEETIQHEYFPVGGMEGYCHTKLSFPYPISPFVRH